MVVIPQKSPGNAPCSSVRPYYQKWRIYMLKVFQTCIIQFLTPCLYARYVSICFYYIEIHTPRIEIKCLAFGMYCLRPPSHHKNQCWLIINEEIPLDKFQLPAQKKISQWKKKITIIFPEKRPAYKWLKMHFNEIMHCNKKQKHVPKKKNKCPHDKALQVDSFIWYSSPWKAATVLCDSNSDAHFMAERHATWQGTCVVLTQIIYWQQIYPDKTKNRPYTFPVVSIVLSIDLTLNYWIFCERHKK